MTIYLSENLRPWNLISNWLDFKDARIWEQKLFQSIRWEQPSLCIYGRKNLIPRQTAFLAEEGISYRYSGFSHYSKGLPSWFLPLLQQICETCDVTFNACLLNYYRNGMDHMGWHSDDELTLDKSKPIASLSIGTSRDFSLKHRFMPIKEKFELNDGDLLIMYPKCQEDWLHSIPVRRKVVGPRINLTFRHLKAD